MSIGALAAQPFWGEKAPVRTGHATTTLIVSGQARIIVDPGLPPTILAQRLHERSGLLPDQITHVFLTNFTPETRRGIRLFEQAAWLIAEKERESAGVPLASTLRELATRVGVEPEVRRALEEDVAILRRCQPAPDTLAPRVDLFPLPGVTPGHCGLILEGPRYTTVIAGDAVPSLEHLEQGQVMAGSADVELAKASFEEVIEIADLIIAGRDNVLVNPTRRPF
jgi:glyoxylase-like metal-dependent hydrolase (beta-lactamase superfamily II)